MIVYTSEDKIFSESVLQAFEKKTGIKVRAIFDTEETKSVTIQRNIAPYRYELAKSGNLPRNTIRNA
ncbi:MAG: hypothetical protein IT420_10260 [Candidatus Brocadia sp.]|nr:hypothetical protein [Candidatus Brocadia sp.]